VRVTGDAIADKGAKGFQDFLTDDDPWPERSQERHRLLGAAGDSSVDEIRAGDGGAARVAKLAVDVDPACAASRPMNSTARVRVSTGGAVRSRTGRLR
jgi:hypothetical protein